jgi:23S rRNA pseudouridine1911/1915/1917 synthase
MPNITKSHQVTDQQSGRVDWIVKLLTNLSHSKMRGMFGHGCVTVNSKPCAEPGHVVKPGDQVDVTYDPTQGYPEKKKVWVDRTFNIVFEDKHILVVNKTANVLTVATDEGDQVTLVDRLTHYLKSTSYHKEALCVHRLDRGVSGLLVFAKTKPAYSKLRSQFEEHKPERKYIAIVAGHVHNKSGTFQSYLQTGNNLDQFSTTDKRKGQLAVTHYKVLQELKDATVVEVQLETGRRNQIRVHFADKGHPVLGDPRYSKHEAQHELWNKSKIALHALSLGLNHPETDEKMVFETPLPKIFEQFIHRNS